MTTRRTSFEFLDISRVEVIDIRTFERWRETLPNGKARSPVVVTAQQQRYWVFAVDDRVPDLGSLEATEPAAVVARDDEPSTAPAIALDGGHVRGLWISAKPYRRGAEHRRSRESWRSADELDELIGDFDEIATSMGERRSGPGKTSYGDTASSQRQSRGISGVEPGFDEDLDALERRGPRRSEVPIGDYEPDSDALAADGSERDGHGATHAIRRTPHLKAPDSIPTMPGSTFTVAVRLDESRFSAKETGDEFVLEVPPNVRSATIGVLLNTSSHFDVAEAAYQPLLVERDRAKAGPVEFSVTVSAGEHRDEAGITALLVYRGHTCGSVTRRWRWNDARPVARAVRQKDTPTQSVVALDVEAPDLSVYITAPERDGIHYCCSVQTSLLDEYADPTPPEKWALPARGARWVKMWLDEIVNGKTPKARRSALSQAGVQFYEAAPESFKRVLWKMIDAKRPPASIYITSVEPSLPWELMKPSRPDAAGVEIRDPLGVEFSIGRWIRGDALPPRPQQIAVERSFVVAPGYKTKPLDPSAELKFLVENLGGERIDPARATDLDERLAAATVQLVHFVCHGEAGELRDVLILDDDEELYDTEVTINSAFNALCRAQRPLVFINACETGSLNATIGGLGGFPKALGDIGARAVIAPLWSVVSTTAGNVAVDIYREALATPRRTLGEIIRDVRARAYKDADFDDSFAAYCLFGDPLATLERRAGEA